MRQQPSAPLDALRLEHDADVRRRGEVGAVRRHERHGLGGDHPRGVLDACR